MPTSAQPNLGLLKGWILGENGWDVGMDANLEQLDSLVGLSVLDKDLSAPPGSPAIGARYIVGASPTGAWSSQAKSIALRTGALWRFFTPKEGWLCWVADEDKVYAYTGTIWTLYPPATAGQVSEIWIPASDFHESVFVQGGAFDAGIYRIDFPDGADKEVIATLRLPDDFAGWNGLGWQIYIANLGTSTNPTKWRAGILPLTDGSTLVGSFSPNYIDEIVTPNTTTNLLKVVTFSNNPANSVAAGNKVKIKISRRPTDAGDTNPDTQYFIGMLLKYTRS